LSNGRRVGFCNVKSGSTFVFPVVERADIFVFGDLCRRDAQDQGADDGRLDRGSEWFVRGKGQRDDVSIAPPAEHFLSKSQAEVQFIPRPVLQKHLSDGPGVQVEETIPNLAACAAKVQTVAAGDSGGEGSA